MSTTHAMRRFTTVGPTRRVPTLGNGQRAFWAGCTCGWQQTAAYLIDAHGETTRDLQAAWEAHTTACLAMYPDDVQPLTDTHPADLIAHQVCASCQVTDDTCPIAQNESLCCGCAHGGTEH